VAVSTAGVLIRDMVMLLDERIGIDHAFIVRPNVRLVNT